MRILLSLLLLAALPRASQKTPAENQPPPFSLTLVASSQSVVSGSPVHIKVLMKNLSTHDVDCTMGYSNGLDRVYEYEVRDSGGRAVEILTKKHPEIGQTFSPGPECALKPGQTSSSGGAISNFYDMTKPGEYTIQVSRRIADEPKDGVVKSNKITVTIVGSRKEPPPPPPADK